MLLYVVVSFEKIMRMIRNVGHYSIALLVNI